MLYLLCMNNICVYIHDWEFLIDGICRWVFSGLNATKICSAWVLSCASKGWYEVQVFFIGSPIFIMANKLYILVIKKIKLQMSEQSVGKKQMLARLFYQKKQYD